MLQSQSYVSKVYFYEFNTSVRSRMSWGIFTTVCAGQLRKLLSMDFKSKFVDSLRSSWLYSTIKHDVIDVIYRTQEVR